MLDKGLDYETQTLFTFSVVVTDGMTNDEAEVSIRVLNVNDWNPDFRYPEYEFFVSENRYFYVLAEAIYMIFFFL